MSGSGGHDGGGDGCWGSDQASSGDRVSGGGNDDRLVDHWSWRDFALVVEDASRVLGLDSWFVAGDGSSEASSVGDVVDGSQATVSISQTIGSSDLAVG